MTIYGPFFLKKKIRNVLFDLKVPIKYYVKIIFVRSVSWQSYFHDYADNRLVIRYDNHFGDGH